MGESCVLSLNSQTHHQHAYAKITLIKVKEKLLDFDMGMNKFKETILLRVDDSESRAACKKWVSLMEDIGK